MEALEKACTQLQVAMHMCDISSGYIRTALLGVPCLQEALLIIRQKKPNTRNAARAYDQTTKARRLVVCQEEDMLYIVLKKTQRLTRDVVILRGCWVIDHRDRPSFLGEMQRAFGRPIQGNLESQVFGGYRTAMKQYRIPEEFISNNTKLNRKRRKKERASQSRLTAERMAMSVFEEPPLCPLDLPAM